MSGRGLAGLLATVVIAVASCARDGGAETTMPGPSIRARAVDFAASADRALIGTRFEAVSIDELARAIEGVCSNGPSFDDAVREAVDGLTGEPGDPTDAEVATEVIVAGVVEVCPERVGGPTGP